MEVATNSPRAPANCDICGQSYSNKANMKRHRISHSEVKALECRLCPKKFHRKEQLQEHWMTHSKPGCNFDCPVYGCTETFNCISHLKVHMEKDHIISAESPATCRHCISPFKTARRLMIHYHTLDLDFGNEGSTKSDDTLESGNDSMDVSTTNEGMAALHRLLNIIPAGESTDPVQPSPSSMETEAETKLIPVKVEVPAVQPKKSRKRKAVKIEQDDALRDLILSFINQDPILNLTPDTGSLPIDETTGVVPETSLDVTQSDFSDRGTPDSNVTGTATETSKCDESVDFEFNGKKSPEIKGEGQKLECTMCEITYNDPAMFFMHKGFHTMNDPFSCNMCGVKCKDRFDFNSHLMYGNHTVNKINSNC